MVLECDPARVSRKGQRDGIESVVRFALDRRIAPEHTAEQLRGDQRVEEGTYGRRDGRVRLALPLQRFMPLGSDQIVAFEVAPKDLFGRQRQSVVLKREKILLRAEPGRSQTVQCAGSDLRLQQARPSRVERDRTSTNDRVSCIRAVLKSLAHADCQPAAPASPFLYPGPLA